MQVANVATLSELRERRRAVYSQGFKANPGLGLANAFSVRCIVIEFGYVGFSLFVQSPAKL
jgi:hypothetical protein